jgi:hypothetical protein
MKYNLVAVMIAKDETKWLREWCAFHKIVGIEKAYVYDNESKEPIRKTLAKEIQSGFVEVIDFPGKSKQMRAYDHALACHRNDAMWMAFLDADEFLVPMEGDDLKPLLEPYKAFGGLSVSWRLFGSSGYETHPEGKLAIETYTMGTVLSDYENTHCKPIVQPTRVRAFGSNPHYCEFCSPYYSVNEQFQKTPNAWSNHSSKKIRLCHLVCKSRADFEKKITHPRADAAHLGGKTWTDFDKFNALAIEEDRCMERFVPMVKAELAK